VTNPQNAAFGSFGVCYKADCFFAHSEQEIHNPVCGFDDKCRYINGQTDTLTGKLIKNSKCKFYHPSKETVSKWLERACIERPKLPPTNQHSRKPAKTRVQDKPSQLSVKAEKKVDVPFKPVHVPVVWTSYTPIGVASNTQVHPKAPALPPRMQIQTFASTQKPTPIQAPALPPRMTVQAPALPPRMPVKAPVPVQTPVAVQTPAPVQKPVTVQTPIQAPALPPRMSIQAPTTIQAPILPPRMPTNAPKQLQSQLPIQSNTQISQSHVSNTPSPAQSTLQPFSLSMKPTKHMREYESEDSDSSSSSEDHNRYSMYKNKPLVSKVDAENKKWRHSRGYYSDDSSSSEDNDYRKPRHKSYGNVKKSEHIIRVPTEKLVAVALKAAFDRGQYNVRVLLDK
jgi:hypothetical protein